METYIFWGSIGILALFSLIGFFTGMIRGLKRAGLHVIFYVTAILLSFFLAGIIANAILKINITIGGVPYSIGGYIKKIVSDMIDTSNMPTAAEFIEKVPYAVVTPVVFFAGTTVFSGVLEIIYLIVARISFGKKKEDLKKHKAFRAYGALVGLIEGLFMMFILFAPISSLTQTFEQIAVASEESSSSSTAVGTGHMPTFKEMLSGMLPDVATEAVVAFNKSAVGKITSVGGINNLMFDKLSTFDFQGEKIVFRKEAANMAQVYDTFAEIYNAYIDDELDAYNTTTFKTNVNEMIQSGIFKTLISNTIREVVINYEAIKADLGLNLPELIENVIGDLKTKFSQAGFNAYQYLSHDFVAVADAADTIFKNGVIKAFKENTDTSLTGILAVVSTKNEEIQDILDQALGLNIIKDSVNQFTGIVDQKLRDVLSDKDTEENLKKKIGINVTSETDIDAMFEETIEAIDGLLDINEDVDIASLLSGGDIFETLKSITNIDTILVNMGKTFDKFKNLSALNLPVDSSIGRTEPQNVFNNILDYFNISLLGDTIYTRNGTTYTEENIDTYEKLFTLISAPVKAASDLGLLEDELSIDSILNGLQTAESTLISDILVPFYQLENASFNTTDPNYKFKKLIFENVVDMIESSINMLDVTAVKTEVDAATGKLNKTKVWNREFDYLGTALKALNQGQVEGKTYIKYLLGTSPDLEKLIRAMAEQGALDAVLTPVFEATICSTMKGDVINGLNTLIDTVDAGAESVTGVDPHSPQADSTFTKAKTISTINTLLNLEIDESVDYTDLSNIGALLDTLKTNAYNGGAKDGVFKEVFANLIWYMTGDIRLVATANQTYYAGHSPNEHSAEVNAILNVSDPDDYYTINYEEKFAEVQAAMTFADHLEDALDGKDFSTPENAEEFIDAFIDAINSEKGTTPEDEAELIEIIENLDTLIEEAGQDAILSDSDRTNYGSAIEDAINNAEGFSSDLKSAILDLLGL